MAEFGALNLEEMAGEGDRLGDGNGSANFLDQFVPMPTVKPGQTGSVAVRVLPPVKGGRLYQYNRVHSLNGRKVHCPRPLVNGKWDRSVRCPICEEYSARWKKIEKMMQQFGKDDQRVKDARRDAEPFKAIERYYYNAIVRSLTVDGKEQTNVGPRILSVGKILHGRIIAAIVGIKGDPESKLGNITDIKAGFDFVIRKTVTVGEENFPKYDSSAFARNPSPAGTPEEVQRWQQNLHDLTKLRNPKDMEYLEKELAIHNGWIQDDSETFDREALESKWRQKAATGVAAEATGAQVSVPAGVPSQPSESAVKAETKTIEDEGFLSELEGLDG